MSKQSTQEQVMLRSALRHRPIYAAASSGDVPPVPRASRVAQAQGTRQAGRATFSPQPRPARGSPLHWLFFVGIGMLLALGLVVLGHFALAWISLTWDDLHYGRPRTFQVDAFVGHETSNVPSHFIALNLHGRVEVIEFPGGDSTHARVFLGPQLYGDGADLVPVQLEFVDSRHDHHPDMLVVFGNSHMLFRNEQGTFHPPAS